MYSYSPNRNVTNIFQINLKKIENIKRFFLIFIIINKLI